MRGVGLRLGEHVGTDQRPGAVGVLGDVHERRARRPHDEATLEADLRGLVLVRLGEARVGVHRHHRQVQPRGAAGRGRDAAADEQRRVRIGVRPRGHLHLPALVLERIAGERLEHHAAGATRGSRPGAGCRRRPSRTPRAGSPRRRRSRPAPGSGGRARRAAPRGGPGRAAGRSPPRSAPGCAGSRRRSRRPPSAARRASRRRTRGARTRPRSRSRARPPTGTGPSPPCRCRPATSSRRWASGSRDAW